MAKKQKKQEALSVSRLINEVLVAQLSIPFRQIVNDTTFSKYTGSKRPDILISEFEYDGTNDEQYIKNLVAYAEAKDDCKVVDKDWKDALKQGKIKAPKLGLRLYTASGSRTLGSRKGANHHGDIQPSVPEQADRSSRSA